MKWILLIITTVIFISCIKEDTTNYTATLVNSTNHNIVIQYFYNGQVAVRDTVKIASGSSFQIADGFNRGISDHAGFNPNYSGDSAIVIFDNLRKKMHFGIHSSNSTNSYSYSSTRNILNYLSFTYEYSDASKHIRNATYTYTFTEQDFLDAQ